MIRDSVPREFGRWILPSLGIFLAIVFTSVHVYVTRKGWAYSGYLLVGDHVFEIGLALVFLVVCASVGATVLDRFEVSFDKALEEALFSTAVGCGIVSTLVFVCGFLFGTRTSILTVVAAALVILARARLASFPRLLAWDRALNRLDAASYDFIYIDGSHTFKDVLVDAVLGWELSRHYDL